MSSVLCCVIFGHSLILKRSSHIFLLHAFSVTKQRGATATVNATEKRVLFKEKNNNMQVTSFVTLCPSVVITFLLLIHAFSQKHDGDVGAGKREF